MISEYADIADGEMKCCECRTTSELTMDEDGDIICFECLFNNEVNKHFEDDFDEL